MCGSNLQKEQDPKSVRLYDSMTIYGATMSQATSTITGWWFRTFFIIKIYICIYIYIGNNHPN